MIVTMDGPAGAGKSTVARRVAERLGFRFLDTGAMYRAVALAGLRRGIDLQDREALADVAKTIRLEMDDGRVLLDGDDVSDAIRTSEVTDAVRHAADNEAVRRRMVQLQREFADGRDVVTEGRDQSTVAFPEAECKIFLTASAQQRAERRVAELSSRGENATLEKVLAAQNRRDQQDQSRKFGRLIRADDAIEVDTDGLTIDQVVDRVVAIVREKLRLPAAS